MNVQINDKNGKDVVSMPDYFCTVGFGLDYFAVKELEALASVTVQQTLVGKVFFHVESNSTPLLALKTVERLFVKVIHDKVEAGIDSLEDWLTSKLTNKKIHFSELLLTWREITNKTEANSPIKFRINSRLSGAFRKAANFQRVSTLAGSIFTQDPNWVIDLHQPDLEVFLHLNDSFLTVGLQITKKPLSDRDYLSHIAVRSTVCCAMCMAVGVSSEDVILDPMCGAATILIEAKQQFNCRAAVGVDSDLAQLELAQTNLETSCTSFYIALIHGDSRYAFLRRDEFDVVLCDVPFGRKFGDPSQIEILLTAVVKTIDFVVKPGGRIGILISEKLRPSLIDLCPHWSLVNEHPLRLGTLPAAIVTWKKL